MYRIGLSCGSNEKPLTKETFLACKKAGIEAMEISVDKSMQRNINYEEIRKLSNEYGIQLWSYHMPFSVSWKIDISSLDRQVRQSTVVYFKELIAKASDIGIDKFVVHPSCEPITEDVRSEKMKCSKESLAVLAEYAHSCGAVIAVENLPRTCLGKDSEEMLELISANEKIRVCFDTNHVLKENVVDFVKNINKKIITLHVSDCDFENERHWLPGEGKIDWTALISALKDVQYNGVWMYELGLKAPDSIRRNRDLTYEDFVLNARELLK